MTDKKKRLLLIPLSILALAALGYLAGLLGQLLQNYDLWRDAGGLAGEEAIQKASLNPLICYPMLLTRYGLKSLLGDAGHRQRTRSVHPLS